MATKYKEREGLSVMIDDIVYMPNLDAPKDKPHPFVYFITIINESNEFVKILGRKWIVQEKGGETVVVEGQGVIGQTPELKPGQNFSYNSYHVTANTATVRGAFFGITANQENLMIPIPEFSLHLPDWI